MPSKELRPTSAAASLHQLARTQSRSWNDALATLVRGKVLHSEAMPSSVSAARPASAPGQLTHLIQGQAKEKRPCSAANSRLIDRPATSSGTSATRSMSSQSNAKIPLRRDIHALWHQDNWKFHSPATSSHFANVQQRHQSSSRSSSAGHTRKVGRSLSPAVIRQPKGQLRYNSTHIEGSEDALQFQKPGDLDLHERLARAVDIPESIRVECLQRLEHHVASKASESVDPLPEDAETKELQVPSSQVQDESVENLDQEESSAPSAIQTSRRMSALRHRMGVVAAIGKASQKNMAKVEESQSEVHIASIVRRRKKTPSGRFYATTAPLASEEDFPTREPAEEEEAEHDTSEDVHRGTGASLASMLQKEALENIPKSPVHLKRMVSFKDVAELQQAMRQRTAHVEAMRALKKPGSRVERKRLPGHCRSIRVELCRIIFDHFLQTTLKEFDVARTKNPLNGFEERRVSALIQSGDSCELVKYLAETELHMKFGPQRSKIEPDAPLNMRIYANLQAERMELANGWAVNRQRIREDRIFGLFMTGPFSWARLRELLWDSEFQQPSLADVPALTDEEEARLLKHREALRHEQALLFPMLDTEESAFDEESSIYKSRKNGRPKSPKKIQFA